MGDEMRRPTIATMDNGLPVQCLSERDFLFPDADEKYVPDVDEPHRAVLKEIFADRVSA